MNLGEKLKAANEARALEKSQAEVRKRESERMKYEADNRTILAFLERCKENFIDAIENGTTPETYKIPQHAPFDSYGWRDNVGRWNQNSIGNFHVKNHPNYNAFQQFFYWADANGLVGKFLYEHDGMGMESWYVVAVEPKE